MRVGMEATGYSCWFERLLAEPGIELWIGDAAKIKSKRVRATSNSADRRLAWEFALLISSRRGCSAALAARSLIPGNAFAFLNDFYEPSGSVTYSRHMPVPTPLRLTRVFRFGRKWLATKPGLVDRQMLCFAHDGRSLNHVLQFADVPRPGVGAKQVEAFFGYPL